MARLDRYHSALRRLLEAIAELDLAIAGIEQLDPSHAPERLPWDELRHDTRCAWWGVDLLRNVIDSEANVTCRPRTGQGRRTASRRPAATA